MLRVVIRKASTFCVDDYASECFVWSSGKRLRFALMITHLNASCGHPESDKRTLGGLLGWGRPGAVCWGKEGEDARDEGRDGRLSYM